MGRFTIKENHIGPAVSEIPQCTHLLRGRHLGVFFKGDYSVEVPFAILGYKPVLDL